jgi:hypothetical protein
LILSSKIAVASGGSLLLLLVVLFVEVSVGRAGNDLADAQGGQHQTSSGRITHCFVFVDLDDAAKAALFVETLSKVRQSSRVYIAYIQKGGFERVLEGNVCLVSR